MHHPHKTTLFCILARNSQKSVIFRRGPTKQVLLILWDRKKDQFKIGQWFRGRIYERRCDLSPSGNFLIYCAGHRKYPKYKTWTAVSSPPQLETIFRFSKEDAWGGGGLFENESKILLNHSFHSCKNEDQQNAFHNANFNIQPLNDHSGSGEDFPIYDIRLRRDDWSCMTKAIWFSEIIYEKLNPKNPDIFLKMTIKMTQKKSKASLYETDYQVFTKGKLSLERLNIHWADWDTNGDFLFSEDGKLFRIKYDHHKLKTEKLIELADFRNLKEAN